MKRSKTVRQTIAEYLLGLQKGKDREDAMHRNKSLQDKSIISGFRCACNGMRRVCMSSDGGGDLFLMHRSVSFENIGNLLVEQW